MDAPKRGRPKNAKPKKILYARIDAGLRDRLEDECKAQRRSLSATVEIILEYFFGSKSKGK